MEKEIDDKKKYIEDKIKEPEVHLIQPVSQTNEESIVQSMSRVSFKDLEIVGIRNQTKVLEDTALNKEEERKVLENKCKYLLDKNDKLKKKFTRKLPLQGARH